MKFVTTCLIIACAIFQIDSRALRNSPDKFNAEETCVTELHLNLYEVKSAVNQIITPEDNAEYGKFFVCVWKKRGVMDEEGNINSINFRKFLEELSDDGSDMASRNGDVVNRAVKKCSTVQGDTIKQTAIKLKNCMAKVAMGL